MTTTENKKIVLRFLNEFIQQGNIDVTKQIVGDSFKNHTAPDNFPNDITGLIKFAQIMHEGFSNFEIEITEMIAENNSVAVRRNLHALHSKNILGHKATGKEITIQGLEIFHLNGGKITDYWSRNDKNIMQALEEIEKTLG
ncbi:MAG: ester cyclase [Bacteroidetes bacterium]|nr:ester cyclase [Bacteroidota bacterium]